MQPGWVDDLAGAPPPEEIAPEEVLFTAEATRYGFCRATRCPLMCQKPFEDVDRGGERRTDRTAFCFAVPTAIRELIREKASDDAFDILMKVNAQRESSAVDAGLHLSAEKWLPGVLPMTVISD